MKFIKILATALVASGPVLADPMKVSTDKSVNDAADALVAVIEKAGAKTFVRVDHGAGAKSIGSDIGASQLIIFGNPKVGTPAMEANRLAGLALPLKVLVYEDSDGKVWLAYEDPAETIQAATGAEVDAAITTPMSNALAKLTGAAAK